MKLASLQEWPAWARTCCRESEVTGVSFLRCELVACKLGSSAASLLPTVFPPHLFFINVHICVYINVHICVYICICIQICVWFWHSFTSLPVLLASCIPTLFSTHTRLCCHVPHRTTHWVFHFYLHTQAIPSRHAEVGTFAHKDFFIACFIQTTLCFPHLFFFVFYLAFLNYTPQKSFGLFGIAPADFLKSYRTFSFYGYMQLLQTFPYLMGFTFFLDFFFPTGRNNTEINTVMYISSHITAFLFVG